MSALNYVHGNIFVHSCIYIITSVIIPMLFSFIKYKLKLSLFELTFINESKAIFLDNFNNLSNFEKIKNKERKEKKI